MRPTPAKADRPALGIRDVAPESVLVLAGGRAILLQLANPAVGHGVARHSDFASRPLGRLNGTLAFVYAVTCGTPIDRAAAVRRVALAHRPVHSAPGADSPAPAYNAFDPHLQLWVAATLYESATRMHDLVYGPLADADAESVYRDYGVLGTALQVPPGMWPVDRAAFAAYWLRATAELSTDTTTRGVADQLLHSRTGPPWLRLAMPLARLVTTGLLEPDERALFALPWSAGRQRRFDALLGVMRLVYPRLPARLRHAPMRHYLRAGRAAD
ncbi:oxygenase MpaB family protein [Cryobacterium sp. AP23]